jgi:D-methionine transport system ATP-binding protein
MDFSSHEPYLLRDASFEIFAGDRLGIVGPSGSGKTTLLRLLNRLSDPTSGVLYWENQPYGKIPVLQLRQQIVLVPQESKLLGMTVQEAMAYPLQLRGLPKKAIQQRVGEWLERLHIPMDWLNRTELQLSVGQRQRVAIARALAIHPQVLLLDEPTSALDVGSSQELIKILQGVSANHNTTLVMVNHQLNLAQQLCDRVLYLQAGTLLQDQPTHEIDWQALEQRLQQTEHQQAEEWQ